MECEFLGGVVGVRRGDDAGGPDSSPGYDGGVDLVRAERFNVNFQLLHVEKEGIGAVPEDCEHITLAPFPERLQPDTEGLRLITDVGIRELATGRAVGVDYYYLSAGARGYRRGVRTVVIGELLCRAVEEERVDVGCGEVERGEAGGGHYVRRRLTGEVMERERERGRWETGESCCYAALPSIAGLVYHKPRFFGGREAGAFSTSPHFAIAPARCRKAVFGPGASV